VDNSLSVLRDGLRITFVINEQVEQDVFVAIRIARCIHGLGDNICGEFTNVAVIKFNAVNALVHNRIGICVPNGIAASVAFPTNCCSTCKRVTAREHQGSIDVIVTCLWSWQFDVNAEGWGRDLIIRIAGEPIASERAPALHPFVIPTGIVNIIQIVEFRSVGDIGIREIVRSCLWAEFVKNVQIEFDSTTDMDRVRPLHISESAIRRPVDDLSICLEDFSSECRAHVDRWTKEAADTGLSSGNATG